MPVDIIDKSIKVEDLSKYKDEYIKKSTNNTDKFNMSILLC